ncbi:endoribonuclease XendoU, partial [Cooperia oncophora]
MDISRKLRKSDNNKAQEGQIILDFQGRTEKGDGTDNAEERLFVQVDKSLLKRPSYRQFLALTDNFSREPGVAEPRVSAEEFVRVFCSGHPYAVDPETFRKMVTQLWFGHYSRSHGPPDTSGFEHVFIGEGKKKKKGKRKGGKYGEVGGLHNWLRFYSLEKNVTENFDYKGFIEKAG